MDEADAFTGHDDAGPAYCEVYNHAPVLAIRLQNADQVVAQTPELELVQWAHRMERTLEAALTEQQAFKPPCRSQGTCHVFCLNPELSARQQANTLLLSAHKLQQLLPTLPMPKGFPPVWDIALHAGHYAGAVVGKSSWTYDLYGTGICVVRKMIEGPCTGVIKCSSDFLQLLDHKEGWTYVQDISCRAGSTQVFRLKGEDLPSKPQPGMSMPSGSVSSSSVAAPTAAALAPPAPGTLPVANSSSSSSCNTSQQVQQPERLQQQVQKQSLQQRSNTSANANTSSNTSASANTSASTSITHVQEAEATECDPITLTYTGPTLEKHFSIHLRQSHNTWDFVATLILLLLKILELSSKHRLGMPLMLAMLRAAPLWLCPVAAQVLGVLSGNGASRGREQLLALHRVATAAYCSSQLLPPYSSLGVWSSTYAYALLMACLDTAMFRVRFRLQLVVLTSSVFSFCLPLLIKAAQQVPVEASSAALQQLVLLVLLPGCLGYLWEMHSRRAFLGSSGSSSSSSSSAHGSKAKKE